MRGKWTHQEVGVLSNCLLCLVIEIENQVVIATCFVF